MKIVWLGAVLFNLAACGNAARVETKADSLRERLDTMLKRTADSAKQKGEETLEAIREKVEAIGQPEDSVRVDTVELIDTVKRVKQ